MSARLAGRARVTAARAIVERGADSHPFRPGPPQQLASVIPALGTGQTRTHARSGLTEDEYISARSDDLHRFEPGERSASRSLLIRRLGAGESWRPWNYGLRRQGRRVGSERVPSLAGYQVLGAFDDGQLVGCAQVTVCGLAELYASEEFAHGDQRNGPFIKSRETRDSRFLLLHSLWVDPAARCRGVGGALCQQLAQFGLATYAQFASEWVEHWFVRRYSPAAGVHGQAA